MGARVGCFVACAVCLVCGEALAQTAEDIKKAKAAYEEAQKHYKVQEYEEALSGYKEAYLLSQKPELLFNIAQCYRLLERYDEAIRSYHTYLSELPDSPSKTEIEEKIEELIKELEGARDAPKTLEAPDALLDGALPPPTWKEETRLRARVFYSGAAGSAVGGLVLGGLSLVQHLKFASSLEANNNVCDQECLDAQASRNKLGIAAGIVGAGAVGIGVAGYLVSPRKGGHAASLAPSGVLLSWRPAGLALSW